MVRKYRVFSHEIALEIRFLLLRDSSGVCARKIVDRCYLVRVDRFIRERISNCVSAPQFKCTIFVPFRLAMKRTKDITKILDWTLSFEFNDSCFHFVSLLFFIFVNLVAAVPFILKDFIFTATSSQILVNFPANFFFSFFFIFEVSTRQASEWTNGRLIVHTIHCSYRPRAEPKSSTLFALIY